MTQEQQREAEIRKLVAHFQRASRAAKIKFRDEIKRCSERNRSRIREEGIER
jgi:hypothetical protein